MADFSGLSNDLNEFKTLMADKLDDVVKMMDDATDQAAIEAARGDLQALMAQLRAGIPDANQSGA